MSNTPDPSISGKKRKKFETFQTISASKNYYLEDLEFVQSNKEKWTIKSTAIKMQFFQHKNVDNGVQQR